MDWREPVDIQVIDNARVMWVDKDTGLPPTAQEAAALDDTIVQALYVERQFGLLQNLAPFAPETFDLASSAQPVDLGRMREPSGPHEVLDCLEGVSKHNPNMTKRETL